MPINVRENRRGNQEWKIQRNWQHWVHKTQDEDKQQQQKTTQKTKQTRNSKILDITIRKHTQKNKTHNKTNNWR